MKDKELIYMAGFKLEECAKRMLELADEVESNALRNHLSLLSRQLLEHARRLGESDPGSGTGEPE